MPETAGLDDEVQLLRREREQLGIRLLELQRRLASASLEQVEQRELHRDIVEQELRRRIGELEAENAAIRRSFSWRIAGRARRFTHRFRAS